MKKFEVLDYLNSAGNLGTYGFTNADVNAFRSYLETEPTNRPSSKKDMLEYGFNAHQIHRLELLQKVVLQQIDLSDDELIRKHLAKLNNNSVSGKSNVKNFNTDTFVQQKGIISGIEYKRWQLLNGKGGKGLPCKIIKVGKETTEVEIPQVIAVQRGESFKVKGVGEILKAENKVMTLRLENKYVKPIKCYRYYLASSVPTKTSRYCVMMKTGEKYYVTFDEVTKGKISGTQARTTIGFSYGDNIAPYLYRYALLSALLRSKSPTAKEGVAELKVLKFTGNSTDDLETIRTLVTSKEWQKKGVMNSILQLNYQAPGSDEGL